MTTLARYAFYLEGFEAPELFVGAFEAKDEETALKEARKYVKQFREPGWTLRCRTTGNGHSVMAQR